MCRFGTYCNPFEFVTESKKRQLPFILFFLFVCFLALLLIIEYFPFVFYLAPYYEYVASCLSNSASLRVKYGFANGD
jgi:hypothetical protein